MADAFHASHATTNRTNLELKPSTDIPPNASFNSTNRTNLELKRTMKTHGIFWPELPIAPIWNWNTILFSMSTGRLLLPIAPIWNWNENDTWRYLSPSCLPIAPIWNWNKEEYSLIDTSITTNRTNLELKQVSGGEVVVFVLATNRTNLELKPFTRHSSAPPSKLPIAPIWNWNWRDTVRSRSWRFYQSHQSGIETYQTGGTANSTTNYQSHQSGIETSHRHDPAGPESDYQSHQSGIETYHFDSRLHCPEATNRTNLELKQTSRPAKRRSPATTNRTNLELKLPMPVRIRWPWCYQSHQSGIETR